MGENSLIGWTDHTFNPWAGCSRISPGCQDCYADNDWARRWHPDKPLWRRHGQRMVMSDSTWRNPVKWNREAQQANRPAFTFCASMADVFEDHPGVVDARTRLWDLIDATPWLRWQLLTKRPENVARMVPWADRWPDHVLLGTSVENQQYADTRLPVLRSLPVAVRFLSCEPLLGPVELDLDGIGWVIVGGKSGGRPRPFDLEWARSIRDQCAAAGIPVFVKQMGTAWARANGHRGKGISDGQEPALWPEDLRVQQIPPAVPAASVDALL
ncbi:hypothetical protein BBK14_07980 [Parafrankia soli]|uniref:Phage Gp37/Gp68 family protein n=1 Tax=Parafrankia soli TaxID=2599596 RepID=A0A1S1PK11_9ACTN|nr:phage Gp37/Gp68 family protein [Parafrankia soli]OHV21205.1 hypothetical protein BBK14_07980 [Parafrankia soli]